MYELQMDYGAGLGWMSIIVSFPSIKIPTKWTGLADMANDCNKDRNTQVNQFWSLNYTIVSA